MPSSMPLPKYHQIYLVLKEEIKEGKHSLGLPSEFALMSIFNVARVTIRKALQRLEQDDLITREAGKGTFPKVAGEHSHAGHIRGLLGNIIKGVENTRIQVIELELMTPSPEVKSQLRLSDDALVQKVVRIRYAGQTPVSLITTYVPAQLVRNVGQSELEAHPILLLLKANGVEMGRVRQTISARLADASVSKHLGVNVGEALLSVDRLVHDKHHTPVQWLKGLYRPDRYEYQMELSENDMNAQVWVAKH